MTDDQRPAPSRWVHDEDHRRELEHGSGVSSQVASAAGLWSEDDPRELSRMTGLPARLWGEEQLPALVFPYRIPGEQDPAIFRVKPKKALAFERADGTTELRKYVQPKGLGTRLYFPPGLVGSERRRRDASLSLLVTEGEKKTLAADSRGLLCVGLSGVSCWSQRQGRKRVLHEDWAHLELRERRVFIVFDSDATTNLRGVRAEEKKLAKALRAAGAIPHVVRLPEGPSGEKWGLDDFLVARGAEALRALCREAKPAAEDKPAQPVAAPAAGTACTDLGNAERLVARHGADIRWCEAWSRWLVWDGRRWAVDETGEVMRRAADTVRHIYREAADEPDADRRNELVKHASRSESANAIRNMVGLARTHEGIPIVPEDLDADPLLVNVANGVVDLRTGTLRAHQREDLLTKLADVDFDPGATAPTWEGFLARIFAEHEPVIGFVQRAIGYALTGDTGEQKLFFAYGTGANGKSTLFSAVEHVFGDYARQAAPELLVERGRGQDGHPTEVADLQGCRLAFVTELAQGRSMAEGLVKRLTGEKRIKARFMRQDFFTFTATHKLWIAANHRPTVKGTDEAIWRRIVMVPFEVTIPPEERDPRLLEKLQDEAPGILSWAVRGCLEWRRGGLQEPPEVLAATEDYRADSDILGGFMSACCTTVPGTSSWARDLYDAYKTWCEDSGEEPITQTTFGRRLRERGLQRKRGSGGAYRWHGITLKSPDERGGTKPRSERLNGCDPREVSGAYARARGVGIRETVHNGSTVHYEDGTSEFQDEGTKYGRRF